MPYLTIDELNTHMYAENIGDITRDDDTIVQSAIDTALDQVKTLLSKYDLMQLFGDDSTPPTVTSLYLKKMVKDVAVWELINLGNPNISYEHVKGRYEFAMKELEKIQAGKLVPKWPYLETTGLTYPKGDGVSYIAQPKRPNNF